MGDNVYGQFIMIGKTFDGKVAIAIVSKENEGDSELTPLQAAYVLNKMGWKDIMCVGWLQDRIQTALYLLWHLTQNN